MKAKGAKPRHKKASSAKAQSRNRSKCGSTEPLSRDEQPRTEYQRQLDREFGRPERTRTESFSQQPRCHEWDEPGVWCDEWEDHGRVPQRDWDSDSF